MPGSHTGAMSPNPTSPNRRTPEGNAVEHQQVTMDLDVRSAHAPPADVLRVQVYTTWDELAHLSATWEQVLRNSIGPTIFSTPEWLGAWWRAYGHDTPVLTLVFATQHGEVVGLVPLCVEKLHGRIRCLRLVGDGRHSDNLDLIVRAGYEDACVHALLDWLAASSAWDNCELNTLPADSATLPPLLRGLKQRGWVHASYARPNSAVPLPSSWEAYLQQLPSEHAHNVVRYMRRLQRHHTVHIFRCSQEEELPHYLDVLFDLHQLRWTARGEPGSLGLPGRRQFYADMSRDFLCRGWLEFWLLELDGEIAAAQFAFRYGETVYQLQEGFDPARSSDRVGQVLRAHIIQQLIADGVRCYDFLGGTSPHKQSWGAQAGSYTDVHFAKPFSRGSLDIRARDSAKAAKLWLRSNAPHRAYSILSDIYHRIQRR